MTEESPYCAQVVRSFKASPERVFDAWLDLNKAKRFLFAFPGSELIKTEIDARVGGRYSFVMRRGAETLTHEGEYLEIDRPRKLVFTFAVKELSPNHDRVTIEISPEGEGCQVRLRNEMNAEDWEKYGTQTEAGWSSILGGLADLLDA